MTGKNLTDAIRREAKRIGFDKIGITPATVLEDDGNRLEEWLRRGFHGTMAWMDRQKDKRIDIRKVFPEIRSVLVVAVNYYADVPHTGSPEAGKISRYAWGDDYHEVVTERLEQLLAAIKILEPSAKGLAYVDTGPIMEKVWAERAGIGWRGKHTNVITTELGSWVFLGVLLLNLDVRIRSPGDRSLWHLYALH